VATIARATAAVRRQLGFHAPCRTVSRDGVNSQRGELVMTRVVSRVESQDRRILPGASSGGTYLGDLGNPVLTDLPGGSGDGIQVLSSKWATSSGTKSKSRIKAFTSKLTAGA